ncbi:MAG TPA: hypothetical protein VLK84_20525 [Longimicrobium sp.]|nr:hypothetical protein [Longimicrobium sp.]
MMMASDEVTAIQMNQRCMLVQTANQDKQTFLSPAARRTTHCRSNGTSLATKD